MSDTSTDVREDERPEGLQGFVSRRLIRSIVTGELKPGERLSPARLAEELGVSHIPVREALAGLEAVGHVNRVPRVGFFVAEVSSEDMEDIYHWRQYLEDEAHRLAVPKLTNEDLDRMRKLTKEMSKSVKQKSGARFLSLNRDFHFIPFERAGSDHLLRFLNHLWDAASRYQNYSMADVRVPRSTQQEHHIGLMKAFEDRDVEAANRWMAEHRGVTLEAIRVARATDGDGQA